MSVMHPHDTGRDDFENMDTTHHGALETDDNHLKRCPACRRKAMKKQQDANRLGSTQNTLPNN